MKTTPRQFSLGSLMVAVAVFAVAFANRALIAKFFSTRFFTTQFLMEVVSPVRLIPILVALIVAVLLVFHYLVLSPCLWLMAVAEHRLRVRREDGCES